MNKPHTRLRWDCRRGMLELDLILLPFLEQQFPLLNEHEKNLFERLLSNNDQDLYDWLIKKEDPADQDKDLQMIIEKIRGDA